MYAYVARAADEVDPPEDWDDNWPFPPLPDGPLPEEYPLDPVFAVSFDVVEGTVGSSGLVSILANILDLANGGAAGNACLGQPLAITATCEGQTVRVKKAADDAWADNIVYVFGSTPALADSLATSMYLEVPVAPFFTITVTATLFLFKDTFDSDTVAGESDLAIEFTLPAAIASGTYFDMSMTAKDADSGDVFTAYGGENLSLVFYGLKADAEEWEEAAAWEFSNGSDINTELALGTGWVDGVWSNSVRLDGNPEDYAVYKVVARYSGVDCGEDTVIINVAQAVAIAIKERQLAYGITTAWDENNPADPTKLIDDTGVTQYTVANFIAYLNKLATGGVFLDPAEAAYVGGAALPVTLDDNTWANDFADEAEILAATLSLGDTKVATEAWMLEPTQENPAGSPGLARTFTGAGLSTEEALWNALANAQDLQPALNVGFSNTTRLTWNTFALEYQCLITWSKARQRVVSLTAGVQHKLRFFGNQVGLHVYEDFEFDAFGSGILEPAVLTDYMLWYETTAWVTTTTVESAWVGSPSPPDAKYSGVVSQDGLYYARGHAVSPSFAIVEWNFKLR